MGKYSGHTYNISLKCLKVPLKMKKFWNIFYHLTSENTNYMTKQMMYAILECGQIFIVDCKQSPQRGRNDGMTLSQIGIYQRHWHE